MADYQVVNIRLSRGEVERLRELAREKGYSFSELLRVMLRLQLRSAHRIPAAHRPAAVQPPTPAPLVAVA